MHPLLTDVESGTPGAVDALREACRSAGGPLRRRHGDSTVVTFVWFGDDGPVALQTGLVDHGRSTPRQRIAGTPVWWHEAEAPSDTLVSYRREKRLFNDPERQFGRELLGPGINLGMCY